MTPQEIAAIVAAIVGGGKSGNQSSTTTSKQAIKLTNVSAKQLLDSIARDIQFTGKFTTADINAFVASYNKTANEQLETVVKAARDQVKPGENVESTVSSLLTTTFPTFFDPKQFTQDFIWKKINFADVKNLGAKSLVALTDARSAVRAFNLSSVSESEVQAAAKKIARGELTLEQYKAQLVQQAKIEYPQLAPRFDSTPGATTRQLYSPIINAVAAAWEMDPESIDLNDPFMDKLLRPDGVVGKMPPASVGQASMAAMNHSNFDGTLKAIDNARDSATSFARALGWGI
jgi:NAD(P)H-dependent FMN reductase